MAKLRGARVLTTVSNEEKALLSLQAGADEVILYTQSDFAAEVKRLTDGRGLATVYDPVGEATFEQSLTCLRPRGTLVLYGSAGGGIPPLALIRPASRCPFYVTPPVPRYYSLP